MSSETLLRCDWSRRNWTSRLSNSSNAREPVVGRIWAGIFGSTPADAYWATRKPRRLVTANSCQAVLAETTDARLGRDRRHVFLEPIYAVSALNLTIGDELNSTSVDSSGGRRPVLADRRPRLHRHTVPEVAVTRHSRPAAPAIAIDAQLSLTATIGMATLRSRLGQPTSLLTIANRPAGSSTAEDVSARS